jgi:hypothetical protein
MWIALAVRALPLADRTALASNKDSGTLSWHLLDHLSPPTPIGPPCGGLDVESTLLNG